MRVRTVKPAGKQDVYNMEVNEVHDFVIQGGVVVHNCADEWRYFCMSRPIKPVPVETKYNPAYGSDPLDQFRGGR